MEPESRSKAADRKRARSRLRLAIVATAMLGTVVAIWFGSATVVARQLLFPTFYSRPRADHQFNPLPPYVPHRSQLTDPRAAWGAEFESLEIRRSDGLKLRAWFIAAQKPAALILLHPAATDRRVMLPYGRFLHSAGFPVLMLDSVDSGQSDDTGWGVGYGWREQEDVLCAAETLRARGFSRLGTLGVSQGAAAALFAQAHTPVFAAIVSDSAFADLGRLFRRIPSIAQLNPLFAATVLWEAGLVLGRAPDRIAPVRAAANLGSCALLLIQGRDDRLTAVADAEAIYAAASEPKELWIVDGAAHTGALSASPDEYARRVTAFFDRYLVSPGTNAQTKAAGPMPPASLQRCCVARQGAPG